MDESDRGFGLPGSAFQRVGMCTPTPRPRGVAPVLETILARMLPSRLSTPVVALSDSASVLTVTPMRMKTPAIIRQWNRCTGDGLDCNAIVL